MKKYVIGIAIAAVFVIYSLVLRNQHSAPIIAPTPKSSSSNSASSSTSTSGSSTTATTTAARYRDGNYTGSVANAYYGNVQVAATISGGRITAVNFVQSPNENPNSIYVNQQADPYLKQEAIQSQSPNVGIISGATFTSQAFIQSLTSALNQAKA